MSLVRLTETQAAVIKGGAKGAVRGGAVGAAASIATGAAVTVTAPAWLPFFGGSMLVAAGTIAFLSGIGSDAGAVSGGVWAYARQKRRDTKFREAFGD